MEALEMVARLIHRHAISDQHYPGAVASQLADVACGNIAIFGAAASSALAVRDAAHNGALARDVTCPCVDLGNLDDAPNQLQALVSELERRGATPLMLGSDAELGSIFVNAFADVAHGIILLSPRLDLRLQMTETRHALAIGTQRLIGKASLDAWHERGGTVISAARFTAEGAAPALSNLAAHVSAALLLVDLAAIDTGYAAGAALRNVGGLSPIAVIDLAETIIARFDIRGLALLNLAPERDPRGHSERIAAMIAGRVIAQGKGKQVA
jgi:arginase family enzyme